MAAQIMHIDNRPDSLPHNSAVHARGRMGRHLACSPELAKIKLGAVLPLAHTFIPQAH